MSEEVPRVSGGVCMSPIEDLDFLVSRGQERHAVRGLVRVDLQNTGLPAVGTAALESWLTMAILASWFFFFPGKQDICVLMKSPDFFFVCCQ